MEDQEELASTNQSPKAKEAAVCEECKEKPSKYKCPGCSIRTCSLACVKAHKQRTDCSGKRNVTQFVPLSQFDDKTLLSDFNFLEETKRVAESAQRLRRKFSPYPYFRLSYPLQNLRSAAESRRTKLLFLPDGMTKRKKNQTRYNQKKKFITWTIEWRFHSTDVVLVNHGVHENTSLCSVIENHLKPSPWNHKLKQFCEEQLDRLKFFIRTYPKGPRSTFRELDTTAPLKEQLSNIVILEYPVIYVFLPSHGYDFEVVKDTQPITRRPVLRSPVSNYHQSQRSIPFREEEIEEEEDISSSNPKVIDLMKHLNSSPRLQVHNDKEPNNLDRPTSLARTAAGNNSISSLKTEGLGMFEEDMEFDFDQGLIDAYSNLISEVNPDDYLDLEGLFDKEIGLFDKEMGVHDTADLTNSKGGYLEEEELEEGEIPE